MARNPRNLALDYSREALSDLADIWEWNASDRGADHADGYIAFLRGETDKLAKLGSPGRSLAKSPGYRYQPLRKRDKGHGHVVIFEIVNDTLRVLRYFHTAQDWETRLLAEKD